MPVNTIRVDTVLEDIGDLLEAKLQKYVPDSKWFYQFEIGKITGKPHIQGWCDHHKNSESTFRLFMNKFISNLSEGYKCSSTKSFAMCTNFQNEQSYLINNPAKILDEIPTWTNYSSEELEIMKSEVPQWVERTEFLEAINKSKKKAWHLETMEILEDSCVSKNLCGEKLINYKTLEANMKARMPKSLDTMIYKRNLVGCTFHLELRVGNKRQNCKVQHFLSDSIKNDLELNDIFN